MRTLKKTLLAFYVPYVPPDVLGDVPERTLDVSNLSQALNDLKKDLNRRSWITFAMILLLFIISLGVVLIYLGKPEQIVAIFSALGISTGWTVIQMNKWWKQIAQVNLIIVLCTSLEANEMNEIVKVLIEQRNGLG